MKVQDARATTTTSTPGQLPRWNPGVEGLRAIFNLGARELRISWRMPAYFLPNLFVPVFFYFVMVASIEKLAGGAGFANYRAFQLPSSIVIAVMSGGGGLNMVTDIESGYFDKLLLTPAARMSLLIGSMGADFIRILVQALMVTMVAFASGLHFATGFFGAMAMVLMAGVWGLAYSSIGFTIALRTGNAQATQAGWALFLPLFFLSTTFAPLDALFGWLKTAATFNPLTYVLAAMRSFSLTGLQRAPILQGLLAVALLAGITMPLALHAMKRRVS